MLCAGFRLGSALSGFTLAPRASSNEIPGETNRNTDLNQSATMNIAKEIANITHSTGTAWPTPRNEAGNPTNVPKKAWQEKTLRHKTTEQPTKTR